MKKQKIINLTTIAVFLTIVFGLMTAFLLTPGKTYSPKERRKLQRFPKFSWTEIQNGNFTADINEYLNDQFPLRDFFVGIECGVEKLFLKNENNGVLFGKDNQLAVRLFSMADGDIHEIGFVPPLGDFFYPLNVGGQLKELKKLAENMKTRNVPTAILLPPRTIDVACSAFAYPKDNSDKLLSFVRASMEGEDVNFIDLYDLYRQKFDGGETVYFKTDHHWTTLGAYYAYVEIMKSFGMDFFDKKDFERHVAAENFYGTAYAKAGDPSVQPDVLEYWSLKGENPDDYIMEVDTGKGIKTFSGFYDFDYLDKIEQGSDKYSMFLSSTNKLTLIKKEGGENRETLLMLKDSFGHSLAPFLALHFDLVIVDFVNYKDISGGRSPRTFAFDKALVCYNLENLVSLDMLKDAKNAYQLLDPPGN